VLLAVQLCPSLNTFRDRDKVRFTLVDEFVQDIAHYSLTKAMWRHNCKQDVGKNQFMPSSAVDSVIHLASSGSSVAFKWDILAPHKNVPFDGTLGLFLRQGSKLTNEAKTDLEALNAELWQIPASWEEVNQAVEDACGLKDLFPFTGKCDAKAIFVALKEAFLKFRRTFDPSLTSPKVFYGLDGSDPKEGLFMTEEDRPTQYFFERNCCVLSLRHVCGIDKEGNELEYMTVIISPPRGGQSQKGAKQDQFADKHVTPADIEEAIDVACYMDEEEMWQRMDATIAKPVDFVFPRMRVGSIASIKNVARHCGLTMPVEYDGQEQEIGEVLVGFDCAFDEKGAQIRAAAAIVIDRSPGPSKIVANLNAPFVMCILRRNGDEVQLEAIGTVCNVSFNNDPPQIEQKEDTNNAIAFSSTTTTKRSNWCGIAWKPLMETSMASVGAVCEYIRKEMSQYRMGKDHQDSVLFADQLDLSTCSTAAEVVDHVVAHQTMIMKHIDAIQSKLSNEFSSPSITVFLHIVTRFSNDAIFGDAMSSFLQTFNTMCKDQLAVITAGPATHKEQRLKDTGPKTALNLLETSLGSGCFRLYSDAKSLIRDRKSEMTWVTDKKPRGNKHIFPAAAVTSPVETDCSDQPIKRFKASE